MSLCLFHSRIFFQSHWDGVISSLPTLEERSWGGGGAGRRGKTSWGDNTAYYGKWLSSMVATVGNSNLLEDNLEKCQGGRIISPIQKE